MVCWKVLLEVIALGLGMAAAASLLWMAGICSSSLSFSNANYLEVLKKPWHKVLQRGKPGVFFCSKVANKSRVLQSTLELSRAIVIIMGNFTNYSILWISHKNSLFKKSGCMIKASRETLENLPYFIYMKTQSWFYSIFISFFLCWYYLNKSTKIIDSQIRTFLKRKKTSHKSYHQLIADFLVETFTGRRDPVQQSLIRKKDSLFHAGFFQIRLCWIGSRRPLKISTKKFAISWW